MAEVFIRADAGPAIGYGHLVRCLSLAHMISKDFSVTFYINNLTPGVESMVTSNGFKCNVIGQDEQLMKDLRPGVILVVDGYSFGESFDKQVRDTGCRLVTIDDFADRYFAADLVINHAPGLDPGLFRIGGQTRLLLGCEYALLRPAFLAQVAKQRNVTKTGTVVICFGGSDSGNLTMKSIAHVLKAGNFNSIVAVVGGGYAHMDKLTDLARETRTINILHSASEQEMVQVFSGADLAIVSSSGVLFEVIACKTPVISGYYVSNQKMIYQGFKDQGAFYDAENFSDESIESALKKASGSDRLEMIKTHTRLIDGRSGERIRSAFKTLAA